MNIISFSEITKDLSDYFISNNHTFTVVKKNQESKKSFTKADIFLAEDKLEEREVEIIKKNPDSTAIVKGPKDAALSDSVKNIIFLQDEKNIEQYINILGRIEREVENNRILHEAYCDINKADNIDDIIRLLFTKMDRFVDFDVISILRIGPVPKLNIASRFIMDENAHREFLRRILSNYKILENLDTGISDFIIDNELYQNIKEFKKDSMHYIGIPIVSNYKIMGFVEVGKESQFNSEEIVNLHIIITIFSLPIGNFLFIKNMKLGNKRMLELNELRARFLDICSHELRTPISAIDGFVEIFMDGILGEINQKQRDIMVRIKDNTSRLVRLTSDLLDLSKIERDELVLRLEPCNIIDAIESVLVTLSQELNKKNIKAIKSFEATIPNVIFADRDKIIQVVTNILSNSIKYSNASEIFVSVEFCSLTDEYHSDTKVDNVKISIADNGVGIPEQNQNKIFEKFFQMNTKLSGLTGGIGLGLYLCKKIIEMHKGKIWVEPNTEWGAKFCLTIPIDGRTFGFNDFVKRIHGLSISGNNLIAILFTSAELKKLKNTLTFMEFENLISKIQSLVTLKIFEGYEFFRISELVFGVTKEEVTSKGAEWLACEIQSLIQLSVFTIDGKSLSIDINYQIVNIQPNDEKIEQIIFNSISGLL